MNNSKIGALPYGPTITQEQLEDRVLALHNNAPPIPTPQQDRHIRHGELNAMIDHKLGVEFPRDRRERLWDVQQRLDRKRLLHVLKGFVTNPLSPSEALDKPQIRGFAQVLNENELQAFFEYSPSQLNRMIK